MNRSTFESELKEWIELEKSAIELIKTAGLLWLDRSIELVIFRRKLIDNSVSDIINDHLYATRFVQQTLTIDTTLEIANAIGKMPLPPCKLDLGTLGSQWLSEKAEYGDINAFLHNKLSDILSSNFALKPKDVVLYGFGRIGRLAARILAAETGKGEQLRLKAIVTRENSDQDILKRANLLRKDSVHGKFAGIIVENLENKTLQINGHTVHMIAANHPDEIDYTQYGIEDAIVIDNTGVWRDRGGLSAHLKSKGVSQVLLTAPGKGDLPNIVYGINHQQFDTVNNQIFTAASCTTNCIIPVLKVVNDSVGIQKGHVETVHSYTNDQNLLDNFHSKYRRGKSAPLNMVITETGAASAISKVLPELKGKITGNAVRVPTPNVSLAILNLQLEKPVTIEEINGILKDASSFGDLVEQIYFSTSNELVSSDLIGHPHSAIVDAPATIVSEDGKSATIYAWYDNEYGYTRQVIRLAKYLSGVIRPRYY